MDAPRIWRFWAQQKLAKLRSETWNLVCSNISINWGFNPAILGKYIVDLAGKRILWKERNWIQHWCNSFDSSCRREKRKVDLIIPFFMTIIYMLLCYVQILIFYYYQLPKPESLSTGLIVRTRKNASLYLKGNRIILV